MSQVSTILIIEDDESGRELACENLRGAGYEVRAAATAREGLDHFDADVIDLVITDVRLPDSSGLEVLAAIQRLAQATPVIVMTAYTSVELAVGAMKAGAFDFVAKPFSRDQLLLTVRRALEFRSLQREAASLRVQAAGVELPLVAKSEAMRKSVELADRCAYAEAPVLIAGEPGVGKEVLARRIHVRSQRAQESFICVRCDAMPADAFRRELFSPGGKLEQARMGTLFLDEFSTLPLQDQRELVARMDDFPREASPRVIASTSRDVDVAVREGELLDALLRRVAVVSIAVPPLHERVEDIEALARFFVSSFSEARSLGFEPGLVDALATRAWPGNVRQLRNVCERLVVLCPGAELLLADLPAEHTPIPSGGREWPPLPEDGLSLIDLERRVIERVLELKGGNVTQAASYLGVPRHFLAYRIQKYGIR
jgi:two-component system NtrC family response regulator